jgi:hypothetical protein
MENVWHKKVCNGTLTLRQAPRGRHGTIARVAGLSRERVRQIVKP